MQNIVEVGQIYQGQISFNYYKIIEIEIANDNTILNIKAFNLNLNTYVWDNFRDGVYKLIKDNKKCEKCNI